MARRFEIGDRVKMTDELHRYDYGAGIIVKKGYYPGRRVCYIVRSDMTGKEWDYSPHQLKLIF